MKAVAYFSLSLFYWYFAIKKFCFCGDREMVVVVHGFPNEISGLRFEWAWQHPEKSRRLQHVTKKTPKETRFQFNFRVMCSMLRVGPWNRLALTVQWLRPAYAVDFEPGLLTPAHIPVRYGPIVTKKVVILQAEEPPNTCTVCGGQSDAHGLRCLDSSCPMWSHIICLAGSFLQTEPERLLPLEGRCPLCHQQYLWADLIRKKNGCYSELDV